MNAPTRDEITIPRPTIPYGPDHLTRDEADASYLREAAKELAEFYKPFGSNLRATIVKLINDAADAIESPTVVAPPAPALSRPQVARDGTDRAVEHCQAEIWPSWSDTWRACGSVVRPDGRCTRYQHPRDAPTELAVPPATSKSAAPELESRDELAALARVRAVLDEWASADPDAPNHELWQAVRIAVEGAQPDGGDRG